MLFKRFLKAFSGLLLALVALPGAAVEWVFEDVGPLEPAPVATHMEKVEGSSGTCWPFTLNRAPSNVNPPFRPMPEGSALVGFDNNFFPGADPFPCNRQSSKGFTALFRFPLDDVMHTLVEQATLVLRFQPTGLRWRPVSGIDTRCAFSVLRAMENWEPNNAIEEAPPVATAPVIRDRFTHRIVGSQTAVEFPGPMRFDVTHSVRQWVGTYPNLGFVMHMEGTNGIYLAHNNKSCTAFVRATLEMRVGRLVNSGS